MKIDSELRHIIDNLFESETKDSFNVPKEFTGNFERLNQRQNYFNTFNAALRKRNLPTRINIGDPRLKNIYKDINYIPMSPENKLYYEKCYEIEDIADDELEKHGIETALLSRHYPLNYSKNRVNKFYTLITKKACELIYSNNDYDFDFCKFAIVGPPGVGKSALINYLFSINYTDLDDRQICFIRVNLNDATLTNNTLEERLLSKWMRMLAKYYVKKIIKIDNFEKKFKSFFESYYDYSIFEPYTKEKKDKLFIHFMIKLRELGVSNFSENEFNIKLFQIKDGSQNNFLTSADFCLLSKLSMSFLQKELSWGYIIVFDGFDSVTFDQINYAEYSNWLSEISNITNIKDNALYRGVYIVTLRDYSYMRFLHNRIHDESSDTSRLIPKYVVTTVSQKSLKSVIEKRFLYINFKLKYEHHDNLKRNLINLLYMCYRNCDPKTALKSSWDDVILVINELFSSNFRLVFRCFRDLLLLTYSIFKGDAYEYLSADPESLEILEKFRGIEWRVLKLLIYGTNDLQIFLNRTSYDISGEPRFQNVIPVIPNIFNFNEFAYLTKEAELGRTALDLCDKILLKIRILQHLAFHRDGNGILNIFEWAKRNFCEKWGNELRYETRELIFSNLISCSIDESLIDDIDFMKTNYILKLNEKGESIWNILDTSIYYEIIMDNTPIETTYSKFFNPMSNYDKDDTWEYLKEKSKYIIRFICYLIMKENIEIKKKTIDQLVYKAHYQIFTEKRIERIKESICRYLFVYLNSREIETARNRLFKWKEDLNIK